MTENTGNPLPQPEVFADVLTVEDAAKQLRIGRTKMYELVSSGAVQSVTIGRLRRVPAQCIADYVSELLNRPKSDSQAA